MCFSIVKTSLTLHPAFTVLVHTSTLTIMHRKAFCIILFAYSVLTLSAQANRALIIAIDSYPYSNGWTKIHAVNDTSLVIPMLLKEGYPKKNIKTLINKEATKQAVVYELEKMCNKSRGGDYIYIHFSCHGQQMIDDNGDEPDGLDEALILYDAQRWFRKGIYEGENHFRDDEVEVLLNNIRRKIGPNGNITTIFDACHSGTIDRETDDEIYIRGTTYIFGPEENKPVHVNNHKSMKPLQKSAELSPISIFSACQPYQTNFEYKNAQNVYYGSLSYAFYEVIKNTNNNISTSKLFEKIKKQMQTMFANKPQKQIPYFESTQKDEIFKIAR